MHTLEDVIRSDAPRQLVAAYERERSQLVRELQHDLGLKAVFEHLDEYEVLEHATDGLTALQLVERLKPHVLVVDMMMRGINGLEITR